MCTENYGSTEKDLVEEKRRKLRPEVEASWAERKQEGGKGLLRGKNNMTVDGETASRAQSRQTISFLEHRL